MPTTNETNIIGKDGSIETTYSDAEGNPVDDGGRRIVDLADIDLAKAAEAAELSGSQAKGSLMKRLTAKIKLPKLRRP